VCHALCPVSVTLPVSCPSFPRCLSLSVSLCVAGCCSVASGWSCDIFAAGQAKEKAFEFSSTLTHTHTHTHTHSHSHTGIQAYTHTWIRTYGFSVLLGGRGKSKESCAFNEDCALENHEREQCSSVRFREDSVPLFQFCPQARGQYSSVLSGGNIVPLVEICPRAASQTYVS